MYEVHEKMRRDEHFAQASFKANTRVKSCENGRDRTSQDSRMRPTISWFYNTIIHTEHNVTNDQRTFQSFGSLADSHSTSSTLTPLLVIFVAVPA